MKIKNINLLYFRNYNCLNIELNPSLNIFVGNNANGKTNIIESIFFMALGKSFRTKRDFECVKINEEATCMSCTLSKENIEKDIMIAVNNKGKSAKISGVKVNKLVDFVGELNVVLFSPDDLQLVKGSPSIRRDFIDREFYQFSRLYHKSSLMYKHILKQRNTFLKEMRKDRSNELSVAYLETLTLQLSKLAIYLTNERYKFISKISKLSKTNMYNISNNKEELEVIYKSSVLDSLNIDSVNDENFNENKLTHIIMKKMNDDITNGNTKIGVHHDDLTFLINGLDAKNYASQGQQRSIVLSLRLSEISFLKEKTGSYPVLLLDDVLSELDKKRQSKLLDAIDRNIQTFITTPTISDIREELVKDASVFEISDGNIIPMKV
ncbi:DNA replication/repair protein RecF [Gemelliphila palaticanis]|uniref:DNA replication and repair protein RecF n=1 Tax=Gemelliphila palaticanis TaxID=81950 RepID=A0ABX2SZ73_9BACL|nr:DNA replication/repair protein RecF [Gemella palaticanis]MBF0715639.1 DNA replication/repair protein RecF [Gemella palaticanis]NYS47569.1 DNA replication/repair protein RecF [Gemella palaticanis]